MASIEALNRAIFLLLNAGPDTPSWRIGLATLCAERLIYLVPLLLLVLWLWGGEARRSLAVRACVVALLAVGLNQIVGLLWSHPRPSVAGLGTTWIAHAADSSFPSDHATVFAAVDMALLWAGELTLGAIGLVVGMGVAWARVYLGVHFPLDMLGAVGTAALAYGISTPLWRWWGQGLTRALQQLYRKLMVFPIGRGWVKS